MRDVFTTGFFIDLNKVALSINPSESFLSGSVRDIGELESLCYRLCDEKDPIKRASDILYTIACRHPFYEGNKRTGLIACELMLGDDIFITADEQTIYHFVLDVAQDIIQKEDIESWLKANISESE